MCIKENHYYGGLILDWSHFKPSQQNVAHNKSGQKWPRIKEKLLLKLSLNPWYINEISCQTQSLILKQLY